MTFHGGSVRQKAKVALIPLLAALLLTVYWNNGAEQPSVIVKKRPLPTLGAKASDAAATSRGGPGAQSRPIDISQVRAFNPFANTGNPGSAALTPVALEASTTESIDAEPTVLKIDAIVERNGRFLAMVSGKIIGVGDVVDGRRVLRITQLGVVFGAN